MSRRRKPKKHNVILQKGKFYNVHDGSAKGHPGRIEEVDYKNDRFISVTTHSLTKDEYEQKKANNTFRKDYKELKHRTSKDVYKSFINKRPFEGSRDDYGDKEYLDMSFDKEDEMEIEKVRARKPRLGYWYKKKIKKAFK